MPEIIEVEEAGYAYIDGVFQYSGGVAAMPGYEIVRVRFKRPLPLQEGFDAIEEHLTEAERPLKALCACELRSPAPFTDDGFEAFNRLYFGTLKRWGIVCGQSNPVARSCVCPEVDGPEEASLYAFCYTRESAHKHQTFVISGSAECPEGFGNYIDQTVCYGDQSEDAMKQKARWVLGEMERRMAALGTGWQEATDAHVYTVYGIHSSLREEIAGRGAMPNAFSWHFARPPLVSLDYEMDVRRVFAEEIIV